MRGRIFGAPRCTAPALLISRGRSHPGMSPFRDSCGGNAGGEGNTGGSPEEIYAAGRRGGAQPDSVYIYMCALEKSEICKVVKFVRLGTDRRGFFCFFFFTILNIFRERFKGEKQLFVGSWFASR